MRKFNRLLGVAFAVFALQSYAASIYDPGIQYCQSNPALCGLESYGSFESGKNQGVQQGVQQCKGEPSSCGIVDSNGSTTEGISQCQRNPSSCGLETSGSFEHGKTQGIQQGTSQCQQNPSSCGINFIDTNGSITEGILLCQQSPNSCFLEINGSFEYGKNQGIQQCQRNPISCKIPLAFIESKPRASFPNDPEIFVYVSSQGLAGHKQSIFDMGMDTWYNYQLISKQRKTSNDPYVFDLKYVNGLQ